MTRPRLSIGSVSIVVFAVAADCMAIRSLHARPTIGQGEFEIALLLTLPMANVLAVVATGLLWSRRKPRAFRRGFVVGGALAVALTFLGTKAILSWLEAALLITKFGAWLSASPVRGQAVGYVGLPGLALFCQLLAAGAFGWLAKRMWTKGEAHAYEAPASRWGVPALVTMMLLLAAPAILTEGIQRWTIDPTSARLPVGTKAVVDVRVMNGWKVAIGDGSAFLLSNGSEVEVDDDNQPSVPAVIRTQTGDQSGDHRNVRVTLLDGDRIGESTSVPRQFLRAAR